MSAFVETFPRPDAKACASGSTSNDCTKSFFLFWFSLLFEFFFRIDFRPHIVRATDLTNENANEIDAQCLLCYFVGVKSNTRRVSRPTDACSVFEHEVRFEHDITDTKAACRAHKGRPQNSELRSQSNWFNLVIHWEENRTQETPNQSDACIQRWEWWGSLRGRGSGSEIVGEN